MHESDIELKGAAQIEFYGMLVLRHMTDIENRIVILIHVSARGLFNCIICMFFLELF